RMAQAAQYLAQLARRDGIQPAAEPQERPERASRPMELEEGHLQQVVGSRRLAQRPHEEPVQPRRPPLEQCGERTAVAARIRRHQFLVGQATSLGLLRAWRLRGYGDICTPFPSARLFNGAWKPA